ncbi:MAG: hypothetical protein E7170_00915 [Firmicutes bacterium]|nr:hypothetical protein [Bacillota bacterium]
MNNLNLEKYLEIANEEKNKRGLDNYIPLYPMLRVIDNKLYVAVMLVEENDNIWGIEENIKPEYWILIDIQNDIIIEFNKTSEKDFVIGDLITKNTENKMKEMSQYSVKKAIEYKEYLLNDIKNDQLPLQNKISTIINNEIEIDGEKVNMNDYLISNLENDIKNKIDDLVDILVQSKYGKMIFYYDQLFISIINEYKNSGNINIEKIKLCVELMNDYYDGVIAIDNMFNI